MNAHLAGTHRLALDGPRCNGLEMCERPWLCCGASSTASKNNTFPLKTWFPSCHVVLEITSAKVVGDLVVAVKGLSPAVTLAPVG